MNTPVSAISKPKIALAFANIFAFAIMVTMNVLSIKLPLNGKSQMQLSQQYDNLFTPAGFTFSIWSIIYTFYIGFIIYQSIVLSKKQHAFKEIITAVSPLFIGVCLCNAGWLLAWHYEYVSLSIVIMLLHLFLLITINDQLQLALPWKPLARKLFLDVPFSLNLGWICIATIANFAAWCVQNHWGYNVFSEAVWTIIMITAGVLIGLFYTLSFRKNIFVTLVVIWSLYGILSKRQQAGGEGAENIIWAAYAGISILLIAIIITLLKTKKHNTQNRAFSLT